MFDIGSNLERLKDEATEKMEKVSGTLDNVVQNASESLDNLNIGKRLDDTASRAKEIAGTAWDEHVADVSFDSEKIERETKEAFRHVDTMYMAENIKTPEAVSNLSAADLLDDLKDKSLDATYAAASYFAAGQYALADGVSAVGDKVKSLELDEKLKTGVDKLYSAPEIASKFASEYGVGSDKFEQTKNELVDKTVETGKAVAYMSGRFAAGAASVVDRAGRTVYGSGLYLAGNKEKAAEVMTTSRIDDFRKAVDDAFDPDEYQETVGDVVDASGQIVAEGALSIVAMANIHTTATAGGIAAAALAGKTAAVGGAVAFSSLDAAGNNLEKNIEKTGEFGEKEFTAAVVTAGATVVTSRLVPFVNGKLLTQGSIERTASKIIKTGVEEKLGARITGSLSLAAVSGLDAGLIKSSQEISKITDYALGLDESFDAKKEALETLGTVAGAAALGGASYFAADTIRNSEGFSKVVEKFTGKEYTPQATIFDKVYNNEIVKTQVSRVEAGLLNQGTEILPNTSQTIDGVKYYADDVGRIYRRGDSLVPDSAYEINGYRYETDDLGRIKSASGELHLKTHEGRLNIKDSIDDIGKGDELIGDDRGHLIGDQFDGSNGMENMIPQDAEVNEKEYRIFEDSLAKQIKEGHTVNYSVKPTFEAGSARPTGLDVEYSVDGERFFRNFGNGGL